jgi:ELWxxDGT repeat protein
MRFWLQQLFTRLQFHPGTRRATRRPAARKAAPRPNLLWLEDRVTPAMPFLVADINDGGNYYLPDSLGEMNGVLFFRASDPEHGEELWKSDGTEAGTVLVKDINPGPYGSLAFSASLSTEMNGTLFFTANDGVHGMELWKSDGTEAGTVMVKDINPGAYGSNYYQRLVDANGVLFFTATDTDHTGLWKSDGTEAGTVLVKEFLPGFYVSAANDLTNVNGTLFFSAADNFGNFELWKSDGTEAGTVLVKDINPGPYGSYPRNLGNMNGTLFLTAFDPVNGPELWKSDGTEAGTVLVKDINPGPYGSAYYDTTRVEIGGIVYFAADDGVNGTELWKTDGTEAGTVMVKDIFPGAYGRSYPRYLTDVNGTLLFTAIEDVHGRELWKSDGTESGTVLVKDILPGIYGSVQYSANPTNVNGTLFFAANDGVHGNEVWKSDGTETGTVLAGEVVPGDVGGFPRELTRVGSLLIFTARDETFDRELWALDINNSPVLDTAPVPMLPAIPILGATLPEGGLVSDLTENVTDADPGALKGIAVAAVDNSHGTWQYNLTGAVGGWIDVPAVSPTNALLLTDDGNTRVRFVPARGFQGFASISFKAWDQTNRAAEGTFDDTTDPADTRIARQPSAGGSRSARRHRR